MRVADAFAALEAEDAEAAAAKERAARDRVRREVAEAAAAAARGTEQRKVYLAEKPLSPIHI